MSPVSPCISGQSWVSYSLKGSYRKKTLQVHLYFVTFLKLENIRQQNPPALLWSYFFFQWVMIGHQFTAICCSTSALVPDWWWPWGWTELDGPCLHDSQPAVHLFSNTVPSEAVTPCLCRIFCVSLAARLSIVMHFHFVTSSGFCFIRQPTADGTRKGSWLAVV